MSVFSVCMSVKKGNEGMSRVWVSIFQFDVQTQLTRASCHFMGRSTKNDQIFILLLSEV